MNIDKSIEDLNNELRDRANRILELQSDVRHFRNHSLTCEARKEEALADVRKLQQQLADSVSTLQHHIREDRDKMAMLEDLHKEPHRITTRLAKKLRDELTLFIDETN